MQSIKFYVKKIEDSDQLNKKEILEKILNILSDPKSLEVFAKKKEILINDKLEVPEINYDDLIQKIDNVPNLISIIKENYDEFKIINMSNNSPYTLRL